MKTIALLFILLTFSSVLTAQSYSQGDHELFFMSTAYTMPKNCAYLTNYEFAFMNFGYSLTSTTHLSLFSILPLGKGFQELVLVGVKQNYLKLIPSDSSNYLIQSALFASIAPFGHGFIAGNVISIGKPTVGFHLGLGAIEFNSKSPVQMLIMVGFKADLGKNVSFIAEYTNTAEALESDFSGFITGGFRFRTGKAAMELGLIKSIVFDNKSQVLPILKFTFYFD